jgi:hypothetical protein
MKQLIFVAAGIILSLHSGAQENYFSVSELRKHVEYLASDKLEGRNTGSAGEKKAYRYAIKEFRNSKLSAAGSTGFLQAFTFPFGLELSGVNQLSINNSNLELNVQWFPVAQSGNGKISAPAIHVGYGIEAPSISYNNYETLSGLNGKIFIMECSSPDGDSPHSTYAPYSAVDTKIETAIAKGAAAIVFTNSMETAEDLSASLQTMREPYPIPVVFVKSSALPDLEGKEYKISLQTNLSKVEITGHNVAAFLNNGAKNTIVIGAHYDHLGFGKMGNSLHTGASEIHNGADDNASGTAGVISLARYFSENDVRETNNFLFLLFSAEELGLIGSKHWISNSTVDTSTIRLMVNMDMIGRYNEEKGMELAGLGTSPAFSNIKSIETGSLKVKYSDRGTAPTDITSFYYANIPVLNFFTGTHEDYHKPGDDAEKLNYEAQSRILQYLVRIVESLLEDSPLEFTKSQETSQGDVPKFTVRLGIIPDYMFEGKGVRVDGVQENQPAQLAGIEKGDIIQFIGEFPIADIMAYMKALSAFQKGDETTVKVLRGAEEKELKVRF